MRTQITTEDLKDIFLQVFRQNDETFIREDEETRERQEQSFVDYFNIDFYAWKNRVIQEENQFLPFDDFVSQIETSLNRAYGLVEITDASATPSQDMDSATIMGKVTFLIQADKIANLDYYISKIRNTYLGKPEQYQNSHGNIVTAMFDFGTLIYESEPTTMQFGETVVCSVNFSVDYINEANNYADYKVQMSVDGTFFDFPFIKMTWQQTVLSQLVPTQGNITRQGVQTTGIAPQVVFSTYEFKSPLMEKLNKLFWKMSAYEINGVSNTNTNVHYPVDLKVTIDNNEYLYKMVITDMEKAMDNGGFPIMSISLKAETNL